jgi:hypothetical protein
MEVGEEHADVTVRNSDIDISLEQENICTESLCIEKNDMNKLQCGQCKRKVHYKCTRLPAYQLQRYLVASLGQYYSKFLCSNCVVVPDSIQKELAAADNIFSLENELTMQKEKIEIYEQELKELRKLVDDGKKELGEGIVVVFASKDDKVGVAVGVTNKLTEKYDAVKFVKVSSEIIGGQGGGGRKDFAQAGGQDQGKINEAYERLKSLI